MTSMTKRERVLAAIRHEKPDRTPHNVFFTNQSLQRMIEHTGNPDYIDTIDNHISLMRLRKPKAPIPGKPEHLLDEFGVEFDISGADKDIGAVANRVLNDVVDIYAYQTPEIDEAWLREAGLRHVAAGGDTFTVALLGFSLFERAWSLCGMENLLCYMITDKEAVRSLFTKLVLYNIKKIRIAMECGFDGVMFGDDWGYQRGLIMGPALWRSFIKPFVSEMYACVRSMGRVVLHHSCGDCREIMGDLVDMGLDVYQTFQPEIYGLNKLPGLTIWGGISTQADLPFKTPGEIYDITKRTMEVLGKGGGYIAAPTHDVPGDVPPENIEAMIRAFKCE